MSRLPVDVRPWRDWEVALLRKYRADGWGYGKIGEALDRSESSIARKAKSLRLVDLMPVGHVVKSAQHGPAPRPDSRRTQRTLAAQSRPMATIRSGASTLEPLASLEEPLYVIPERY